jgi:hypothetical protein
VVPNIPNPLSLSIVIFSWSFASLHASRICVTKPLFQCRYLQEVSNRLFSEGLHRLGEAPNRESLHKYLTAYMDDRLPGEAVDKIANCSEDELEDVRRDLERQFQGLESPESGDLRGAAGEAIEVRRLLDQNTQEIQSVLKALNGEYVLPEAGGDLLRDGPGVLPTGELFDMCLGNLTFCCCNAETFSIQYATHCKWTALYAAC